MKPLLQLALGLYRLLFALVASVMRLWPQHFFPQPLWPQPNGAHAVGVHDTTWVDHARVDPRDLTGQRRLPLRFWYPAQATEDAPQRLLATERESDGIAAGFAGGLMLTRWMARRIGRVKTASHENATPLALKNLPVMIFSHGLSGWNGQNTHLAEHMASHGYLVISIAHPYSAAIALYDDGSSVPIADELSRPDLASMRLMLSLRNAKSVQEQYDLSQQLARSPRHVALQETCVGDISFVISALLRGHGDAFTSKLTQLVDASMIAACGMSFGGSISAVAAHRDHRISAAINLDGGQFGIELFDHDIRVPLLVLNSSAGKLANGHTFNDCFYSSAQSSTTPAQVWRYLIPEASHIDFTDLTLFGRGFARKLMLLKSTDGLRMLELTAALVQGFLNRHLRKKFDSFPITSAQGWPECRPQAGNPP